MASRDRCRVVLPVLLGVLVGCTHPAAAPGPAAGPVSAPAATLRWAPCSLPGGPDALVRAVVPGGGGLPWVAVGQVGGRDRIAPAVWSASDGCGWHRVAVAPVTPDGERTGFLGVARIGRLTAALGQSTSAVHGNIRPTLWRADGTGPLREVELPRELFGGPAAIAMSGLAATSTGFLVAGSFLTRDHWPAVQIWHSTDAAHWQRPAPPPALTSTAGEQLSPRALVADRTGALVVGTARPLRDGLRDGADAAAWYAPAPATGWQRGDAGLAGLGDQSFLAATRTPTGYTAVAAAPPAPTGPPGLRSATSPDGRAWTAGDPLPLPTALGVTESPPAALAPLPGGGVLATAVTGGHCYLWRSPDGRHWTPEVAPPPANLVTAVTLTATPTQLSLILATPTGPRAYLTR